VALKALGRGREAVTADRPAEAEAPLLEAVRLEPTLGFGWLWLGRIYLKLDRPVDAVPAYEIALANPSYLGRVDRGLGRLEMAQALSGAHHPRDEVIEAATEAVRLLAAERSSGQSHSRRRPGGLAGRVDPGGPPMSARIRFHHVGVPTRRIMPGMIHLAHLHVHVTDHEAHPLRIQWMRYGKGCRVPPLVRNVPHVAFEVDDLDSVLKGKKILIPPNSPSPGVKVAMIDEAGFPVELLEFTDRRANRRHLRAERAPSRSRPS
jgi:hypothetical protein